MRTSIHRKEEEESLDAEIEVPEKQRFSLRKKLLFTSTLVLLSLLLAFFALEIYLRISRSSLDLYVETGRKGGPNPMSAWATLDAFAAYRPRPEYQGAGKTVNSHGFMSTPEISTVKPPGTVRLVFLGESSTAGTGVNLKDSDTWPWKTVERIRQKTGARVDFINAAAGGYTTFESYGRLWSRLRYFDPDIVIVTHGWNEMYYFDRVDDILSWRTLPDGSWSFDQPRMRGTYEPYRIDPLLRWSQALVRVRLALARKLDREGGDIGKWPRAAAFDPRGLEIFRTNLKLIRPTSEMLGARLVVAKQATLVVPGASQGQRERCGFPDRDYDAYGQAFRKMYRVIEEEIPADSVVDVTPVSGRLESFYEHIHPTPTGTTEIAAIVSDFLVPMVER